MIPAKLYVIRPSHVLKHLKMKL